MSYYFNYVMLTLVKSHGHTKRIMACFMHSFLLDCDCDCRNIIKIFEGFLAVLNSLNLTVANNCDRSRTDLLLTLRIQVTK